MPGILTAHNSANISVAALLANSRKIGSLENFCGRARLDPPDLIACAVVIAGEAALEPEHFDNLLLFRQHVAPYPKYLAKAVQQVSFLFQHFGVECTRVYN